jgi:hypothetical protein
MYNHEAAGVVYTLPQLKKRAIAPPAAAMALKV